MTEARRPRSRFLLGVAVAMGLTLALLLIATAWAQNRYDVIADVQGFDPVDGRELWADRLEPASQPRFAGDFLVFVSDERVFALDAAGELQWSTSVPGSFFADSAEESVAVSARDPSPGDRVVYLDVSDGSELQHQPEKEYRRSVPNDSVAMYLGDPSWLASPDGSVAATLGWEAPPVEGAVTYLDIRGVTHAVDTASGQVLWTRADKRPVAATTGMAVFKYGKRYEVVASETGLTVADVPLKRGLNVHTISGRVLLDTGPSVVMVEADGTTTELYDEPGQLRRVSEDYAAVLKEVNSNSTRLVVIELNSGGVALERTFRTIYGSPEIDGTKLRMRHRQGGTEVDLLTGEHREIDAPYRSDAPDRMEMTEAVLVFDSAREHLLWTTPALHTTSVGFLGETLVVSTPRFEHRDP